jgi:hypothetical protein
LFLERGSQAIEACLPQAAVLREPPVEFAEGFRPERVEAALSIRPHRDEARFVEDAQMAGDPGLVDTCLLDDVEPEPCNCLALRQATRRVTQLYDEALAPMAPRGLGVNQYSILARLKRAGPSTILGIDPPVSFSSPDGFGQNRN